MNNELKKLLFYMNKEINFEGNVMFIDFNEILNFTYNIKKIFGFGFEDGLINAVIRDYYICINFKDLFDFLGIDNEEA